MASRDLARHIYEQSFLLNQKQFENQPRELAEVGEVIIRFPWELKHRICAPWSKSLIVKVFGRSVGYLFLVNNLNHYGNPQGASCVLI
jgi:hypothetical protein